MLQGIFLFFHNKEQRMELGKQYSRTDILMINGLQVQIWRDGNSLRFRTENGGKTSLSVAEIEKMIEEERKKGNISISLLLPAKEKKEKRISLTLTCRFLAKQVKLARSDK